MVNETRSPRFTFSVPFSKKKPSIFPLGFPFHTINSSHSHAPDPSSFWVYASILFIYSFVCFLFLFCLMGFLVGGLNSSCVVLTCRGSWSSRRVPGYAHICFSVVDFRSETARIKFFDCYKIVHSLLSIWILWEVSLPILLINLSFVFNSFNLLSFTSYHFLSIFEFWPAEFLKLMFYNWIPRILSIQVRKLHGSNESC